MTEYEQLRNIIHKIGMDATLDALISITKSAEHKQSDYVTLLRENLEFTLSTYRRRNKEE